MDDLEKERYHAQQRRLAKAYGQRLVTYADGKLHDDARTLRFLFDGAERTKSKLTLSDFENPVFLKRYANLAIAFELAIDPQPTENPEDYFEEMIHQSDEFERTEDTVRAAIEAVREHAGKLKNGEYKLGP